MKARSIARNVDLLGAVDWDRRQFESLMPLPDGTSYNSYLIRGTEATALVDTVDPTMLDVLLGQLANVPKIDYIVTQHAEQDHSGSLPAIIAKYPEAQIVCSTKCKPMLLELLPLPEDRIVTVEDGETLSLGDKTLRFVYTPWVHWPETMVTYLEQDRILFTCDFFGSHLATSEIYADESRVYAPAKRYYAEIMMPFRKFVQGNLDKLAELTGGVAGSDLALICPSHGPIYNRPAFILGAYRDWAFGDPKNIVVLPYATMHGGTKLMVDYLVSALVERGVIVEQINLAELDLGKLSIALVDAATIVIGTPTVLGGPHPAAAYAAFLANVLKPKAQFLSVIGSYGWSGRTVEQLTSLLGNLRVEFIPPVLSKGLPGGADFVALDELAEAIAAKHTEIGARQSAERNNLDVVSPN